MTNEQVVQAESTVVNLLKFLDVMVSYGRTRLCEKGFYVDNDRSVGKDGGIISAHHLINRTEQGLGLFIPPYVFFLDKIIDHIAAGAKDCFGMGTPIVRLEASFSTMDNHLLIEYRLVVPWLPKGESINVTPT